MITGQTSVIKHILAKGTPIKMNIQNKAIVAVAMHRMINADGNASPEEIEIFNLVCYHCGINL